MESETYDDPPLWRVLDTVARWTYGDLTMSRLAGKVRTRTGYAGAYRAIGRMVAAGYAEYDVPNQATPSPIRTAVKLTPRGHKRWLLGRNLNRQKV